MKPRICTGVIMLLTLASSTAFAQSRGSREVPMDPERAADLYVSNRPEDHPQSDYAEAIAEKAVTDSIFRARASGAYDFEKISYPSSVDGLEIPAYIFRPIERRGEAGRPALIWVHGGVHGNWDENYLPFVIDAVERGYVVVAPEYRGSTGYGQAFHEEIDYGGYEVEDVMTAVDYLEANVPEVDPERIGIMGWSHGGFITALAIMREEHPFVAGAAIVPVTNLIFRLSMKGPRYQRYYATQKRLQALPYEDPEAYIARSPVYQVDELEVPLLVHVATNDTDVDFVENEMLVHALKVKKPNLSETKVYVDPIPGSHGEGHSFSRRVDPVTLEKMDTPAQRDSWNRVWTFFDWTLRPYQTEPGGISAATRG